MRLIIKIQQFMHGRYGTDDLYKFLLSLYIILAIINIFLRSNVFLLIELTILMFAIYRSLSKNIVSRRKENKTYLRLVRNISKPLVNIKRNIQDKEHIYKRCTCGTTLKLPLPKNYGIKHAECPNCRKRVTFLAFKKEKIVIISKNKQAKA